MKTAYLNCKRVRILAKENGKRTGSDFLLQLDRKVEKMVLAACKVHNGGKQTLDKAVAIHAGIN